VPVAASGTIGSLSLAAGVEVAYVELVGAGLGEARADVVADEDVVGTGGDARDTNFVQERGRILYPNRL
jgi:hypothetical protein